MFCNVNLEDSNSWFTRVEVHSYNTGFSETGSLYIKYSRTNRFKYSFSRFLKLSDYSLNTDLSLLYISSLVLHILELEDTYVDTPTLINKLSKIT